MKHLRLFKTEAEYSSAILELPNVSFVEETVDVKFNPSAPASPNVVCTYNVIDVSQRTTILNKSGLAHVTNMIVDGVEMDISRYYQFDTVGNHVVEFVLYDPTSIGNNTFQLCKSLTSINIPDSVTSIGNCAFYNCSGLTSFVIPDSVTYIGDYAFDGCEGLTGELVIPNSVTYIGDYAFDGCEGLTSINIPDGVTSIGNNTFSRCSGLTSINIPDGVTVIEDNAFSYCSSLTSINIPDSVTSIGSSAFYSCTGLTSVTIGSGVTSIGNNAFECCSGLTSITCYATTAPSITSNTFYYIKSNGVLYYPSGSNYSSWMSTGDYYLGKYNWTIQYI